MEYSSDNETGHVTEDACGGEPEVQCMSDEEYQTLHTYVFRGWDVMVAVCIAVNLLLLATVFSNRQLRRGASAALVVTLTTADMMGVFSNRVLVEVLWEYELHPAADIICKVSD